MKPISPARIRIYHWIPQVPKTVFICSEMEGDSVRGWAARLSCFVTISANHSFRVQSRAAYSPENLHAQWAQHPNGGFRGARMSGRLWPLRSHGLSNSAEGFSGDCSAWLILQVRRRAQERREREPNSVYAERRAKLAAQAMGLSSSGVSPAARKFPKTTSCPGREFLLPHRPQ